MVRNMENQTIIENNLLQKTIETEHEIFDLNENDFKLTESFINNRENTEKASIIKPIKSDTVHKICSGQVVLSLAIAVKELVENAIDSGGTNIEVKLKEYGSELIEVIDNGSGVLEQNFAALTLKHYTSKLKEFTDLESVATLGFRGEALSSLCALSNVSITTRHTTANIATKLEYDHNGKIISKTPTSRSEGTTVSLSNIFSTLPVRRKEFLKNVKREFNKMCQLLYAYCLVSVNIKITCNNQTSKGTKTTIMATQGSCTVRENIINVFSSKQISCLIDISLVEPSESVFQEYDLKLISKEEIPFNFECYISSVMHASGRSTTDRQFFYINSRPCELTKIMKLVNEVYRQFNGNQYPFVYLNILIEKRYVDVNVTPDKRQIFLDKEKLLLAVLKSSLLDAFKNFPSTYTLQNLNISKCPLAQTTLNKTLKGLKRTNNQDDEIPLQRSLFECFKKKMKRNESEKETLIKDVEKKIGIPPKKQLKIIEEKVEINICDENFNKKIKVDNIECRLDVKKDNVIEIKPADEEKNEFQNNESTLMDFNKINTNIIKYGKGDVKMISPTKYENLNKIRNTNTYKSDKYDVKITLPTNYQKSVILNTSLASIEEIIKKKLKENNEENENIQVKFRSQITPDCNQQAEQELQKQITKDKFKKMDIIGQFNLGFIITKLENDLFIIDQHATDEKYNFEQLQINTVLETQTLVSPKPLELTAANENLLIENEHIFKKNGFTFSIDHTAEATKKVKLTAIPVSKNYSFGKDDIDELLFILQEGNDTMCRPSRIRQMFASRACRKSVMIGKALTENDMRRLVDHMGEIDQPWNCPHGRPTMRHLVNMNLIQER